MHFMPSEALSMNYEWAGANLSLDEWSQINDPVWFHNYIHDIESLWWVALWSLCFFTVESADLTPNAKQAFDLLFPLGATSRSAMTNHSTFADRSRYFPHFNRRLATPMELWRRSIVNFYKEYEKEYPILKSFSDEYLREMHKNASERIEAVLVALQETRRQQEMVKRTWVPVSR